VTFLYKCHRTDNLKIGWSVSESSASRQLPFASGTDIYKMPNGKKILRARFAMPRLSGDRLPSSFLLAGSVL
jgi:hypothetical protein